MHAHETPNHRYFDACNAGDRAAPAVKDVPTGEPVGFDYAGRGHHLAPG